MTEHEVVIAGGGPTGMMLAAELTLAGTDVVIVERRASFELESPRSRGLHSRTIEVLDQRGVVDRFLAEGRTVQVQAFGGVPLDISDFPTRHNYGMALLQSHFERIMSGWIDELGVPILREREVTGFTQDDSGVDVALSDGTSLRAQYPGWLRRGPQRRAQGGRHRFRGLGSNHALDHRRGRDGRDAGIRPAWRWRHRPGRGGTRGRHPDRTRGGPHR